MQRLVSKLPEGFHTHNTGYEHAVRVSGDEKYINLLRERNGLEQIVGLNIYDYTTGESGVNDGYVYVRKENEEEGFPEVELAGYLLASKYRSGNGDSFKIVDMLVDERYRGQGLGKFLLGKFVTKGMFRGASTYYPKELTVDTESINSDSLSWFSTRGFNVVGNDAKLLLPGSLIGNIKSDEMFRMLVAMPDNWDGCLEIYTDEEDSTSELLVFRNSESIGKITQIPSQAIPSDLGIGYKDSEYQIEPIYGETYRDKFSSDVFAIVDLLNKPYA